MFPLRSGAAMTLMLLVAATGSADDPAKKNLLKPEAAEMGEAVEDRFNGLAVSDSLLARQRVPSESAVPGQSYYGSPGMRIELFGRGALSLLNVTAEDSFEIAAGRESHIGSRSATRLLSEFGWGGGARLMSGSWGIEGTFSIFDSLSLSPGWLTSDDGSGSEVEDGLFDLPLVASRAEVLVGQVVRTFPLSGGRTEFFVGVGVGWMRATDSSTDRLLSGQSLPGPDQIVSELPPEIPPFLEALVPEVEFTADRTSVVYVGSVGLALRAGRILLRPRIDVIISRALTTEVALGFPGLEDLGVPDVGDLAAAEFRYTTSVTPRIFLLSVDVGLGN